MKTKNKKLLNVIQWIFGIAFAVFAVGNGLHWSSIFLLLAAILMLPIKPIRNFLSKFKIKGAISAVLAVVLFFVGVFTSPAASSSPSEQIKEYEETTTSLSDTTTETTSTKLAPVTTNENATTATTTKSAETGNAVGGGKTNKVVSSQVPKYSGTAYTTINNNTPSFRSSELTSKGYEKYSPLDSLGRCGVAIASCGRDTMPKDGEKRGSISNIKPSGWVQAKYSGISGGYLWNRCHLIGWQLSAENDNSRNLITGTRYMNTEGMLPFENMVADYIKETGNHVAYRITPVYDGNNLVASGVQMEAYSVEDNGEGICFNVYCYNVQPGIQINYATGTSSGPQESTAKKTTTKKTTTKTTTKAPVKTTAQQEGNNYEDVGDYVWIPNSGHKYHSKPSCSGMKNPSKVTKEEAIQMGFEPCKKCY